MLMSSLSLLHGIVDQPAIFAGGGKTRGVTDARCAVNPLAQHIAGGAIAIIVHFCRRLGFRFDAR
jgi:hypothetical protein